jgi:hypothetical protein
VVLEVGGEPFVQPQVAPPLGRHQIAEPLMRQLVRHHSSHTLLVRLAGLGLIVQQSSFPKLSDFEINLLLKFKFKIGLQGDKYVQFKYNTSFMI